MSLIHNERTKLTATYLNGVSIAIFAVGGLAPLFSNFYGNTTRLSGELLMAASIVCFLGSFAHYISLQDAS